MVFENFFFFSPVLKSPTHIGFIDVNKMGRKSHTWAPLNKVRYHPFCLFFRHSCIYYRPNSWTYIFFEFSGQNIESSQTWGFCIDFLNHREGGLKKYKSHSTAVEVTVNRKEQNSENLKTFVWISFKNSASVNVFCSLNDSVFIHTVKNNSTITHVLWIC